MPSILFVPLSWRHNAPSVLAGIAFRLTDQTTHFQKPILMVVSQAPHSTNRASGSAFSRLEIWTLIDSPHSGQQLPFALRMSSLLLFRISFSFVFGDLLFNCKYYDYSLDDKGNPSRNGTTIPRLHPPRRVYLDF